MSNQTIKVVLFTCDKCHSKDKLVAYHPSFGWYCRDCLTIIRDRLNETIDKIDMCATQVNHSLGIDPAHPNNNDNQ